MAEHEEVTSLDTIREVEKVDVLRSQSATIEKFPDHFKRLTVGVVFPHRI